MKELLQKVFSSSKKADYRPRKRKFKSRGQSLVEMAISLPLILMLFSGLVEFGFMLNYYLSLLDATRYAARQYANFTPFKTDGSDDMNFYSGAAGDVYYQLQPINVNDNTRKVALNGTTDDVIVSVFSVDSSGNVYTYPTSNFPYHLYGNQSPSFTTTTLQSQLISGGPCEGIIVVEVAYTYHQILNLPWLAWLGSPVLHAYTVMPLQAAEPGSSQYLPAC